MKSALIDTDILSLFLRGHPLVEERLARRLTAHPGLHISILTEYEILSGLEQRNARRQKERFLELVQNLVVCPLTSKSIRKSASLYADLRRRGQTLDDMDLLIAGTALERELVMVTHNRRHFGRIAGLEVEDWADPSLGGHRA